MGMHIAVTKYSCFHADGTATLRATADHYE